MSTKGYIVKDALVDNGARISLISEVLLSKLGIPICKSSSMKVVVADRGLVPCMGIIEDVILGCFGICISMDFHVIPLRGPSYSLMWGTSGQLKQVICRILFFISWRNVKKCHISTDFGKGEPHAYGVS